MPTILRTVAAILVAGCASTASIPTDPPSISGIITHVSRSPGQMTILIEERPEQSSGGDKSAVRITPQTQILLDSPSGATELAPEQLAAGNRASAWFAGPVAESYPTQATARIVVVRPR